MKYGLSGFLAPDGEFYACGYMEHSALAVELVEKYDVRFYGGNSNEVPDFIKFGCSPWVGPEGDSNCHCFIWNEPTPEQLDWIIQHMGDMTGKQRIRVLRDLDYFDIEVYQNDSEEWIYRKILNVGVLPLKSELHLSAVCAFYLAFANQMRRSGRIKVAVHADKQYRMYRNLLQNKMQLTGSYPESAAQ